MKTWLKIPVAGLAALGLVGAPAALAEGEKKQGAAQSQENQDQGIGGAGQQQQGQQQQQQDQQQQQGQQQTSELSGKIAKVQQNQLFLETKDGAVVPLKTGNWTKYEGQLQDGKQFTSLKQLNEGDEVTASFSPQQTDNRAQSIRLEKQQMQQVSGKVASVSGNRFFIDYQGARVPINVSSETEFKGQAAGGKQLSSARDLKPGDEVRASISVENQSRNVAQSVEVTSSAQQGYGGGGFQQDQQQGQEQGQQQDQVQQNQEQQSE